MRAPPGDHWGDTLPAEDRERYRVAWQSYRACRDCSHWYGEDEDDPGVGACDTCKHAAFLTPEDYTCDLFASKSEIQ